jgi:hypothetical protein
MGAARDGAQDVEIGEQGLGGRGVRAHGRARPVVGHAQDEPRIAEDQRPRGVGAGDVGVIEPADLPGAEPMRPNRLAEADTVGGVGARQRHEVLHRGMRDDLAVAHLLLNRRGQRADQTQAPGHPADTPVEAPRQMLQRQLVIVVQGAQQPALLERAVGRVGLQHLPEDQGLRLRHRPRDGRHGVALQAPQTADALVAIHHDVRRGRGHDHDRGLLPRVR